MYHFSFAPRMTDHSIQIFEYRVPTCSPKQQLAGYISCAGKKTNTAVPPHHQESKRKKPMRTKTLFTAWSTTTLQFAVLSMSKVSTWKKDSGYTSDVLHTYDPRYIWTTDNASVACYFRRGHKPHVGSMRSKIRETIATSSLRNRQQGNRHSKFKPPLSPLTRHFQREDYSNLTFSHTIYYWQRLLFNFQIETSSSICSSPAVDATTTCSFTLANR